MYDPIIHWSLWLTWNIIWRKSSMGPSSAKVMVHHAWKGLPCWTLVFPPCLYWFRIKLHSQDAGGGVLALCGILTIHAVLVTSSWCMTRNLWLHFCLTAVMKVKDTMSARIFLVARLSPSQESPVILMMEKTNEPYKASKTNSRLLFRILSWRYSLSCILHVW